MRRKLIIDTDCGSDDAMAIAMALNDERYEVLFFTTVSGNVRVKQAALNTLTTLEYVNKYYPPVYLGSNDMLVRDFVGAADTHGEDGLADLGYAPKRLKISDGDAVTKLLEALKNNKDKEIDLICLGPLTNLAIAIQKDINTIKKANRIVCMASTGFGEGNMTPYSEFNVWQDPDACKVVLQSGLDNITFVGWDACTGESMLEKDDIDKIENSSVLGEFLIKSNISLLKLNNDRFHRDCLDMADPAAMAAALYPECIEDIGKYYCEVKTVKDDYYAQVVVDKDRKPNVTLITKLKSNIYKEYIFKTLNIK